MAQKKRRSEQDAGTKKQKQLKDPWLAFSYLVSGVLLYGLIGWGLDQWLGTTFLVAIGIVAGAGLGVYMTLKALNMPVAPSGEDKN